MLKEHHTNQVMISPNVGCLILYQTTDAFIEEEMWGYTAQGVDSFSKALKDMR